MFWLWGNSFRSIFVWCVFGCKSSQWITISYINIVSNFVPFLVEVIRLLIAYVLFVGVKQVGWLIDRFDKSRPAHFLMEKILYTFSPNSNRKSNYNENLILFQQGSLWKCKIFCIAEFVLLCCKLVILVITLDVIGRLIYTTLIVVLRLFGIRIIAGFIAKLQGDLGEATSFPWNYIQGPKQVETITTCYNSNEPSTPLEP